MRFVYQICITHKIKEACNEVHENRMIISLLCILSLFIGCSPTIGSKEWYQDMREKPKGDWTANEAADFAKYCIFESK